MTLTQDELEKRIREGGGEGWFLPEDFDWQAHNKHRRSVIILHKSGAKSSGTLCEVNGTYYVQHDDGGATYSFDIEAIRLWPAAPSPKALDLMRQLSALKRAEGGE